MRSLRTLCAALIVVGFELLYAAHESGREGANGWDAIFPALTASAVIAITGLGWWLTWVIPVASASASDEQLVRQGSVRRATTSALLYLGGALLGFGLVVAVGSVGVGAALGLPLTWSPPAQHFVDGTPSAFAAAGFARHFAHPVPAIFAAGAFAAAGFLVTAAIAVAASCRGHARAAASFTIAFALWAIVCSLSLISIPAPIDASLTFSLGWALEVPEGLAIGIGWLATGSGLALALALAPADLRLLRLAVAGRAGSMASVALLAVIGSVSAAQRAHGHAARTATLFYAGTNGDIVHYVLIGLIPAVFATGFLARSSGAGDSAFWYQALRRGSYRRWLGAALARELGWAAILVLLVTGILTATVVSTQRFAFDADAFAALAAGAAALLAATILQTSIAAALPWVGIPPASGWPLSVGFILAFGYWFPSGVRWLNVLAPYSLPQDFFRPTTALVAAVITFSVAGVLIAATLARATSRNAEIVA